MMLQAWSNFVWGIRIAGSDAEDANILLDTPFPMSNVITNQLALNLVYICFDNMVQILCKSLVCFAEILQD